MLRTEELKPEVDLGMAEEKRRLKEGHLSGQGGQDTSGGKDELQRGRHSQVKSLQVTAEERKPNAPTSWKGPG